jgi:hypothetical protein
MFSRARARAALASAAVLSQHWPQLSGGGGGGEFQAGRFHARTAGAALSAGAQGRPHATRRAAAMRLRPAHHDRRRDGGDEASGCPIPKCRRAIPRAISMPSARRWRGCSAAVFPRRTPGETATARAERRAEFFAREFPKLQREWSVTLDEQLENRTLKNIERVEPQFQITSSGVQWFDLGVVFAAAMAKPFRRRTFSG